ncbi:hypothetical protein C0583_06415 [Candidatus Parcubacteria bacterium]|nr:MAG: hypothetical protein C0583_06415 [Candidatus Parcubacteria bacterium]
MNFENFSMPKISSVNKKINEALDGILGSDIKMEEIEKKIDESVSLGKQGSFLMDQLSKKAIYQPDIDHAYKLNKGEKLKRLDRIKEFK